MRVQSTISYLLFMMLIFPFSILAQGEDKSEKDYVRIAQFQMDSNKYRRVIEIVNQAYQNEFESAELYTLRAYANFRLKEMEKALADIENAKYFNATNPIINLIAAFIYISQEKSNNAVDELIEGYNIGDEKFFNSITFLQKKEQKKILAYIDVKQNEGDYNKELHAIKSFILFHLEQYNDTYNELLLALDNNQENGFLYFLYGEIKQTRKEYLSAISAYNTAINFNYENTLVHKKKAIALGFIDNFKEAILDYDYCIKNEPNNFEYYYLRAIAKNYIRDYVGALDDLNISIKLNDTNASSYNYRGLVNHNMNESGAAIADFKKALSLDNKHPFTYNNLGLASIESGLFSDAEKYFTKAIETDVRHSDAYYNRGKIRIKLKKISQAKNDLITSLKLNHQNPDAHYQLALCYISSNDKEKACSELNIASQMQHPLALKLLEQLCSEEEETQE